MTVTYKAFLNHLIQHLKGEGTNFVTLAENGELLFAHAQMKVVNIT